MACSNFWAMNILFLCVGNSARSQIAEGLAKEMLSNKYNIESAGSNPSESIVSEAVETMNEIGIDISNQYPKSIQDLDNNFIKKIDYVITFCNEEICPALQSSPKKIHWPIPNPVIDGMNKKQNKQIFKSTREVIFNLLKNFFSREL